MRVLIFTEAGKEIGLGHLSRCTSLYDEISSRGIEVKLIIYGDVKDINFLEDRDVLNEDWINEKYLIDNIYKKDYVIVDSYIADKKIYDLIASISKRVLYIDDNGRIEYPKGIIVNPALDIGDIKYSLTDDNILLTGPEYIILRTPFLTSKRDTINQEVKKVLITMGGTDIKNITPIIVEEIYQKNKDIEFDIIINEMSQKAFSEKYKNIKNVKFHSNIKAEGMKDLMLKSDLAITAAGQTIYELIATQTPFVAIKVADNQDNNINVLESRISHKTTLSNLHNFLTDINQKFEELQSCATRREIYIKLNNTVINKGRENIINILLDYEYIADNIFLRNINKEDIKEVFELSNMDYVRLNSINKDKIKWENHVEWFNSILNDNSVVFYAITNKENEFLGQIRFNIEGSKAIISISISEKLKGKGYAKKILKKGIERLFFENKEVDKIIAFVSVNNMPSIKIFEGVNFQKIIINDNMLEYWLKRGDFSENRLF